jgi:tRNA modification GTPase
MIEGKIVKMADTIAAIATPLALGGVSMIRISGDQAILAAAKIFSPYQGKDLVKMEGYTAAYGKVLNQKGEQIDDGVALVYRAPHSYTGEDVVEISCHGGVYITKEILRLILDTGLVRLAQAGEFSKRAFLNGKLSLTQAESIMDLIHSRNAQAMRSARAQMDGALFRKLEGIKESILSMAGHLAAWVDYPEEEIEEVQTDTLNDSLKSCLDQMDQLIRSFDTGKMIREGIETVIVGKANVGKSTLMNLLSGCEKSIVTDIAGTTRDVIEETVNLGNVILRLADTAGIRNTDDVVEQKGVELSLKRMQTAGLVLAVFDHSVSLEEEDYRIVEEMKRLDTPVVAIINKTDLEQKIDEEYIKENFKHIVYTTSEDETSLSRLSEEIEKLLQLSDIDTTSGLIANERQRDCAIRCRRSLAEAEETLACGMTLDAVTVLIDEALDALMELTGERVTEQVVDQVFHHFCVGK